MRFLNSVYNPKSIFLVGGGPPHQPNVPSLQDVIHRLQTENNALNFLLPRIINRRDNHQQALNEIQNLILPNPANAAYYSANHLATNFPNVIIPAHLMHNQQDIENMLQRQIDTLNNDIARKTAKLNQNNVDLEYYHSDFAQGLPDVLNEIIIGNLRGGKVHK